MKDLDLLLSQAAVLLTQILTHFLPASCSLDEIETHVHRLAQEIARRAAEQLAQAQVAQAEARAPTCAYGAPLRDEQRRDRARLLLDGLIRLRLRRYQGPRCGAWVCPGAAALQLAAQQRLSRTVQEVVCQFGLAWSYAA